MAPFESLGTVLYLFSTITMALCCIVEARYWWKIAIFHTSFAFDIPVSRVPSEYCHTVWYEEKTRMTWLPDGETSLICLAVLIEYRRVTE